ncbi:hypothetical protein CDD83_2056 [Cordyceps sp. RAO-2017]|nr:hypothetical protein CDD83_2056 [Cordyceps sp. RAO-2017]
MPREEQVEEREVLESIFPDEITDISETEFRISVTLDVPADESGEAEAEAEPPGFLLHVRYPDDYPDAAPHLDMLAAPNAAPRADFSVAEDRAQLLAGLEATVRENLGMAMVFTLVTALREAAEQLIQARHDAATAARDEALLAAERAENAKFHGTPVTPDSFLRWRRDFLREMDEAERREEEERAAELRRARVKDPVRLTGKQLWERGLAGRGDDDDADDDDAAVPTEGLERLQVEAA